MISAIVRSTELASLLKATSQMATSYAIASPAWDIQPDPPITLPSEKPILPPAEELIVTKTEYSVHKLRSTKALSVATSGLGSPFQIRFAHTDLKVPDFTEYRIESGKDPRKPANHSAGERQAFTYLIMAGGAIAGTYSAKGIVTMFVSSMAMSADVLALAKIEVKLNAIPEGKNMTFKWRGKPLFVKHRVSADVLALAKIEVKLNAIPEGKNMTLKWRGKPLFVKHRTEDEIQRERSVDLTTLRDPEEDADRATRANWLVVIGVCTHLGCVPVSNKGDFIGGYYCPCHGSHYDAAGRIRKGPAPLNLEIPDHEYVDPDTLVVG